VPPSSYATSHKSTAIRRQVHAAWWRMGVAWGATGPETENPALGGVFVAVSRLYYAKLPES